MASSREYEALYRQQGRAAKYRQLVQDAGRAAREDAQRRQERIRAMQSKFLAFDAALQAEKELEALICKVCDVVRAQAWGLGCADWETRKCSACQARHPSPPQARPEQVAGGQGQPGGIEAGQQVLQRLLESQQDPGVDFGAFLANLERAIEKLGLQEGASAPEAGPPGPAEDHSGAERDADCESGVAGPEVPKGGAGLGQQRRPAAAGRAALSSSSGSTGAGGADHGDGSADAASWKAQHATSTAASDPDDIPQRSCQQASPPGRHGGPAPPAAAVGGRSRRVQTAAAGGGSSQAQALRQQAAPANEIIRQPRPRAAQPPPEQPPGPAGQAAPIDAPASASDSERAVKRLPVRGARPSTEQECEAALREAERMLVFGETQKQRTEALFLAGRLREQLAQLRRATRAVRKARNTHTYSQRAQGMDENGIRRHPPPGPPLTGTSRRPASASANVDAVTWRPAPSKVPLAHPEGWQQAGEFRDDYSHDLAAVRSLPYGDYKAKVMVHREMQKGMLLQHRKPPPKPPPVRSGCELGV